MTKKPQVHTGMKGVLPERETYLWLAIQTFCWCYWKSAARSRVYAQPGGPAVTEKEG